MPKIDAHQHFWHFDPVRDSWINADMAAIQRDFLPGDLEPILKQHGFSGCVTVQSTESEEENEFHLNQAEKYEFIKGVVGWVDFLNQNIDERLQYWSRFRKMKGFRYVLQGASDRALMLQSAFKNGIRQLRQFNFTYDILIYPDQLKYTEAFVAAFPDQPFVIDHLAKPHIKDNNITAWKQNIKAVAKHEHVSCKISGMVTEADWRNWKKENFTPYLDVVVESFGFERVMFGSDWPVCQVAASYTSMLNIVQDYFAAFSPDEQNAFFGGNAIKFYNLY